MARRTVTCRWCYATGHNSSGCTAKKEYIKNNPESWAARRAADKPSKACTYCRVGGHTRKTCSDLAEHMRVSRISVMENREKICNNLSEIGLAPGALVKCEVYVGNGKGWQKLLHLVEGIDWLNLSEQNGISNSALQVVSLTTGRKENVYMPKESPYGLSWNNEVSLVSPVSREAAEKYHRHMLQKTQEHAMKSVYEPRHKGY